MDIVRIFFPELFLAIASLLLLIVNSFYYKNFTIQYLSYLFLFILSLIFLLLNSNLPYTTDISQNFINFKAHYLFRLIIFSLGIVLYISLYDFLINNRYLNEFSFFLGIIISFLSLIISSQNLLLAFVFIEAISFGLYLLISFNKKDLLCVEAGLKYFFLGTLSSIFFFTGLFLIYYSSLEINLVQILGKISNSSKIDYMILGLILIFSSLAFKLGASPFHFWLPEVYQGSPLSVFPILISLSKLAFAIFLANFILIFLNFNIFSHLPKETFYSFFYVISLLSMVIGNLFALKQKEIKRLLAYSSIAHIGYLLSIFAVSWSNDTLKFYYGYIFIYALTNLGIFLALSTMVNLKVVKIPINTFKDLLKNQNFPILISFIILLLSLAGLPPTAGFITKFFLLLEIVKKESYFLAFVFLSTSVLSLYYYFRLISPVLTVLKEGIYKRENEKYKFNEIFIMIFLVGLSFYIFFSTFKPALIFFFT